MNRLALAQLLIAHPWAVLPHVLAALLQTLDGDERPGVQITLDAAAVQRRTGAELQRVDQVAVIPLIGLMLQRSTWLSDVVGAAATSLVTEAIRAARENPQVKAIVLVIDSPGGSIGGVDELGDEVYASRLLKPTIALVDSLAASAAYWVASQASQVVLAPGAQVGAIGVYATHLDLSEAAKKAGITTSVVSAGRFKVERLPFAPLSSEARTALQQSVDEAYSRFVGAVARGRGVSTSTIRGGYGEGRLVSAVDAVRWGMADRIGTLSSTVTDLVLSARKPSRTRTAADAQLYREIEALDQATRRLGRARHPEDERLRRELEALTPRSAR